jgi:hypothetical protein
MNLNEYIEKLMKLKENYGELDIVYGSYDEGRGYLPINYDPIVGYLCDGILYSDEEIEECEDEPNVVCIN